MSCEVGSFALALERVCALFLRPTWRGRATVGEDGDAALLLVSLDCELPIVWRMGQRLPSLSSLARAVPRGSAAFTLQSLSVGLLLLLCSAAGRRRLFAAHAVALNESQDRTSKRSCESA